MKDVYNIIETGKGKNHWIKVGIVFVNKDGSINVKLNCLPLNGTLHIRDRKEQAD